MLLAYLDPGAGSLILQVWIAGLLGGVFVAKHYWHQFKRKVFGGG
jgi:hypothetical protein